MSAFAGSSLAMQVVGLTNPITINQPLTTVIDNGSGQLDISFATTGHVPGSELVLTIPAGQRTGVTLPGSSSGDAINPLLEQHYDFFVLPDGAIAVTVRTASPDTTAPTVLSITTGPMLASLIVTYSKACRVNNLAGITPSYSVGTTKTVTAIASGDGTAKHTYTLSAPTANGDALTLGFAANAVQARTGPALAPVSASVLNVFSLFSLWADPAQGATVAGGHLTNLVEQVGSDPTHRDFVSTGTVTFNASDAKLNGQPSFGPMSAAGAMQSAGTWTTTIAAPATEVMVGYDAGDGTNEYWADNVSGGGGRPIINVNSSTYRMFATQYLDSLVADVATAKALIATFASPSSGSTMRVSAKTPQVTGDPGALPAVNKVTLGNANLLSTPFNLLGAIGFWGLATGAMSAANTSAFLDYAAARWGLTIGA